MVYTYQQLQEISATRRAVVGNKYIQSNGDIYVGISGGQLKLMQQSNNVIVNNTLSTVSEVLNDGANEIDNINLELQSDLLLGYTRLNYDSNGNIVKKVVYLDAALTIQSFVVDYIYDGDDIVRVDVKRVSDGKFYSKQFIYDLNGNLTDKKIIQ